MTVTNWIAIVTLAISIISIFVGFTKSGAKQEQKIADLEGDMDELKTQVVTNQSARASDELEIRARINSIEKQQAVTEATCQSLKENMTRIEQQQTTQGEKIDKILESVYQLQTLLKGNN